MKDNLQLAVLSHDAYWAILPKSAETLLAQLGTVDAKAHREFYEEQKASRLVGEYSEAKGYRMHGSTAILSVSGPMTKKGSSFGSGGTIETRQLLRNAVADPEVKSILMVWDSPGGSVAGTEDLANDIAAAAKKKEVVSYIEDMCASAALWCAVQARSVYANATAIVGSIGVFSYAIDMSQYAENMGIKVHLLSTGKYKGAGAVDGVPIDADQLAQMQKTINALGEHFFSAVARGREMKRERVESLADGTVWVGAEAKSVGLIDGVASINKVLADMQRGSAKAAAAADINDEFYAVDSSPAGETLSETLDSVLAAVERGSARAEQVRSMRAKEGRYLGAGRLAQLRSTHAALGDLIDKCKDLPAASEGEADPEAETEAESDPTSSTTREAADAAMTRALNDASFAGALQTGEKE